MKMNTEQVTISFHEAILDYVNEHHMSSDGKEYDEGWDGGNYYLVKKILKELEV